MSGHAQALSSHRGGRIPECSTNVAVVEVSRHADRIWRALELSNHKLMLLCSSGPMDLARLLLLRRVFYSFGLPST